jgi:hypothetical protein
LLDGYILEDCLFDYVKKEFSSKNKVPIYKRRIYNDDPLLTDVIEYKDEFPIEQETIVGYIVECNEDGSFNIDILDTLYYSKLDIVKLRVNGLCIITDNVMKITDIHRISI